MTVTYIPLPREDVLTSLGPAWPAPVGASLVRVPVSIGVTDGAVVVYEVEGRPGVTWWLVDGVIPPQGAGPAGEQLAALVPDSVVEIVPDPWQNATPPASPFSLDNP
jgi:hypothetical protein